MDETYATLEVKNRQDFTRFLKMLHSDFVKNPEKWENNNLETFLEALIVYSEDIQGYYNNIKAGKNADIPDWQTFADILAGAVVYE